MINVKKMALRIYQWIIISILMQVTAYLFINNIYLANRTNIGAEAKVISASSMGTDDKLEVPEKGIPLPSTATDIKISYDRTYAAYMNEGKLEILDLNENKIKKVILNKFKNLDGTVKSNSEANTTAFKWLSDKNTIYYAQGAPSGLPVHVQLTTYDVDFDIEYTGVTMTYDYLTNGSEITDLAISPLNSIIYAKAKISPTQARYFRINIMNDIIPSFNTSVDSIAKIGRYKEVVLYQDGENKLFRKSGMYNSPTQLQFPGKMVLLDVIGVQSHTEGKDMAYVGELNEEGKVHNVLTGNIETDPSEWTTHTLKRALLAHHIYIENSGQIYGLVDEENCVYNLQDGGKVSFKGRFIGIVDNNIAFIDNDLLKFKPLSTSS